MRFPLCKLYKIESISVFYGMEAPREKTISEDEAELIALYRALSLPGRALAMSTVRLFSENPDMAKEGSRKSSSGGEALRPLAIRCKKRYTGRIPQHKDGGYICRITKARWLLARARRG